VYVVRMEAGALAHPLRLAVMPKHTLPLADTLRQRRPRLGASHLVRSSYIFRRPAHVAVPLVLLLLLTLLAPPPARDADEDDCVQNPTGGVRCIIPLAEDTLMFLENRGVTRVLIDLNGHRFKLATDPDEVARSANAFLIPRHGVLTIHIGAYMLEGFDANVITFITQGPAGTDWRFVIAPDFVEDQTEAAYAIEGLVPFPEEQRLLSAYPNPFRDRTTLTFEIPEERTIGLPARFSIYDARGRVVRRLEDAPHFPGRHEVLWDGRDDAGRPVAAGVYVARLLLGPQAYSVRLARLP